MNIVNQYGEEQIGFARVAAFVMWFEGISTDVYYKELIEIVAMPVPLFGIGPNM